MKNIKSKITVVVPVYNCENYISKCIDSILSQTFEEFTLILIDDGSKDLSGKVCDQYSKIDERIIVIHQENMGVSKTRRKGLEMAKSEYITFVDSDDYLDKYFLENMYKYAKDTNADMVCCNSIDIGANLPKNISITEDTLITKKEDLIYDYFLNKRYAFSIWGKVYKCNLLYDIEFPNIKYAEDTCIILNIFNKEPRVGLIKYSGYYYVQREQSATFNENDFRKIEGLLYRADIINKIVENINNNEFKIKARKEMNNVFFYAILSFSRDNKFDIEKLNLDSFYKYCINDFGIKFVLIKLFKINKNLTKKIINFIYNIKQSLKNKEKKNEIK